jgi:putative SOS response-associated peptidase YedK
MCYDAVSATQSSLKYAKHRGDDLDVIERLEKQLEQLKITFPKFYHVSGFAHPKLITFTQDKPFEAQAMNWGLIPSWAKSKQDAKDISNKTINARSESIFDKPSFRSSAKGKRCLIYLDAFYEHHHLNGKTFPYHIAMKDGSPLAIAGLWDEWVDTETGEILRSVSLVTTVGNATLTKIHNNPKAEGPRMPVILPKEKQDEWLIPCNTEEDKKKILSLAVPLADELLEFHTVKRLKGKEAIGNIPEAEQEFAYMELISEQGELF